MPQENRKRGRGRRGDEKEKKGKVLDELRSRVEEEAVRPAKRQRTTPPPAEVTEDIRLDQTDAAEEYPALEDNYQVYDADAAQDEGTQQQDDRPEAQFFGMLEDSEQAYFKHADLMLENDSFSTREERSLFLDSVWNEAKGKELKIACSQSCSRVLERLMKGSTSEQLKGAWARMKEHILPLVQHRFASHCVEALFLAAAPFVSRELLAGDQADQDTKEDEYEDEEAQAVKVPMEEYYLDTIKGLRDNLGYLITDSFASHALRVLLIVLSGKPLAGSKSLLQSKKKEKVYAGGKQDATLFEPRVVPDSFSTAVSNIVRDTMVNLDTNYLRALATNPIANPVLQLFLELELSSSSKQKAKDDKSLFRRLLPDDVPAEGTQSAAFVKGLLYEPVGSRLLETIIQYAPGKTFKTVYKGVFKDNMGSIVKNEVAGFVIIKILERLSHDELQSATEQIVPQIPLLLERTRHSIIKCLVERCRIRGVSTQSVADAIRQAFGEGGQTMIDKLLQPNTDNHETMAPERKAQLEQNNSSKMHASLLAQTMLSHADPLQKLIFDNMIACESSFLAILAKDRTATHVLQHTLKPELAGKAERRQLIAKLQPHVLDLALDTVGSHVVDALLAATDGLHFVRERMADQLAKHETQIKESYSGRQVWRNWMLDLYLRRRNEWTGKVKDQYDGKTQISAQEGDETGFVQNQDVHWERKQRPQTGIEAARSRFAAQQRKQGGHGKRRAHNPTAAVS